VRTTAKEQSKRFRSQLLCIQTKPTQQTASVYLLRAVTNRQQRLEYNSVTHPMLVWSRVLKQTQTQESKKSSIFCQLQ